MCAANPSTMGLTPGRRGRERADAWKLVLESICQERFDVIRRILESSTVSFYVVCVLTLLGSPLSIFAVIKNLE